MLDLVTNDPNRAMTIASAFAGAATVGLVYLLAARLYDERTARVSAVFVLTAVTFWAYGGVAYPVHTPRRTLCGLRAAVLARARSQRIARPPRDAAHRLLRCVGHRYRLSIGPRDIPCAALASRRRARDDPDRGTLRRVRGGPRRWLDLRQRVRGRRPLPIPRSGPRPEPVRGRSLQHLW